MADTDPAVADSRLAAFSEFLAEQLGLHFPPKRWPDLEKAMGGAARDLSCKDAVGCMQMLMETPLTRARIEILASHLTVGETYFFREEPSLRILADRILPELIARRRQSGQRRLRIWSAGCCTGEEPYSLAILLSRLLPDIGDWNIAILGTDINPHFLRKARRGVYTEWSFRSPPPWLKRDYFTRDGEGRFQILPAIKAQVHFAYHNLAEDVHPALWSHNSGVDVVFCRNVLMYFEPQQARRAVANLFRCLTDGGWLVVSPTEASAELLAPFQAVRFSEAVLHRKAGPEPAPLPVFPPAPGEDGASFAAALDLSPPVWLFPAPSPEASPNSEPETSPERTQLPALCVPLLPSWEEGKNGLSPFQSHSPAPQDAARGTNGESASSTPVEAARLYEQGRYAETEEILSGLLATGQADARALALLARLRANQGRLAEALEWCDKAIKADRLDAAAHYLRANILVEQGLLEDAAAGFRRVVYLDPRIPLAWFALGNLCKRQGKSAEAARHFANALELLGGCDPDSVVPEAEGLTAGRLREIIQAGRECLA